MKKHIDETALLAICHELLTKDKRTFLAIAGAPGSGKSTLVEQLFNALCSGPAIGTAGSHSDEPDRRATDRQAGEKNVENPAVAILPMDGFHYDDSILLARGRRPWKGAPDTFDVGGLRSALRRLADPTEENVAIPVFDRQLEISRGSARIIPSSVKLVLIEGNYLLLGEEPWKSLHPLFDIKVMIEVAEVELTRRLRKRWVHHGLSEIEIADKLESNDLPNGRTVRTQSVLADYRLVQS